MKKTVCLLAALTLSSLALSCQQLEGRIAIREANMAYEQEEYEKALGLYQKARQHNMTFPKLDRQIGYCYIGLFNPEDQSPENQRLADNAIVELQKYMMKQPDDTAAREA